MKKNKIKNRLELAQLFGSLGFKTGAEIGVRYGRYSEILCQSIPHLKLFCIDTWPHKDSFEITKRILTLYDTVIIHKPSMEAVKEIDNESLDFVFIDASHEYQDVKDDIREWTKKVRRNGIVAGHDYYVFFHSKNRGVVDAVNEYIVETGYNLLTTPFDYTVDIRDDRQPCWYFYKDK